MKWTNKGHQYDQIGNRICAMSKNAPSFYIWGAGTFGISFFELFCHEISIEGFVDSNPRKTGTTVCGIPVYAPSHLKEKKCFVLVAAGWTRDIYEKLEQLGYRKVQDYLHIDDFTALYSWYKYKKVCLSDISYVITEKCSLRCEKCSSFMPKIPHPKNIPVENILKHFEQFFQYVDKVNVVGLVGGDAMMHPRFVEIIEELCSRYYPEKAAHIEVYCNAVIVPDQRALQVMKKYDVFYRFTDYRPYTEGCQKVEEVVALLRAYGIRYDHVRFENWLDCGYPQESNGIQGEENFIRFFDMCDRKSCHGLGDGYVVMCGMAANADRVGYVRLDTSDIFDLTAYDESKRIELIEYMLGYSEKGYFNYCRACNGSFNVNQRMIDAGKQL